MNRRNQVMSAIRSFTNAGINATTQTIAASLDWPINRVSGRVTELIKAGEIKRVGSVIPFATGRARSLLAVA